MSLHLPITFALEKLSNIRIKIPHHDRQETARKSDQGIPKQ
jgi:hypothetical protein